MLNQKIVYTKSMHEISRLNKPTATITDFNTISQFSAHFTTNGVVFLSFATAASNQPTTASWGVCLVYYGAASTTFQVLYMSARGAIYTRTCDNGTWGTWTSH